MTIETEKDWEGLKRAGAVVAACLRAMAESLEPGMSTKDLDAIGGAFLASQGAVSAPRKTYGFPGHTCISVNEEVAHGIPGKRVIRAGDLVNIDVSAFLDGYVADTGGSFAVPPVADLDRKLLAATRAALDAAMEAARAGQPLRAIGGAIESTARKNGFSIIRNLGSHGVGRKLHEAPEFIAPFWDPTDKRILKENMVITIEPFLSTGAQYVEEAPDGWTLRAGKRHRSAQFEHSMVITKGKPVVLTA